MRVGRKREREKNFLDLDKFESGVSKRSNQKAVAITPAPNKTGWLYAELTPKAAKTPTEYFKKISQLLEVLQKEMCASALWPMRMT